MIIGGGCTVDQNQGAQERPKTYVYIPFRWNFWAPLRPFWIFEVFIEGEGVLRSKNFLLKVDRNAQQGCKNALNFLTPDIAILNLPNVFLQKFRD